MYFDIGAHIGKWSTENIIFCDKIIAVEADPETFDILKNNVSKSIKPIITSNYVVCNSCNETIDFFRCINADTVSTIHEEWLSHPTSRFFGFKYTKIQCIPISIDKLIEIYGVPELIKIDVEGAEYECITSLTQKVDTLCFEWASELKNIAFRSLHYLKNLGYEKFYVQYEDAYTFRPLNTDYKNIDIIINELHNTIDKNHWGMIWCK